MTAVFPVGTGGTGFQHTTSDATKLGTYSRGFIPQLWSKKLNAKFYANTMLTEVSNTNWEGEIKNHGDTIRIRTAPSIAINDYKVGMNLVSQVPAPIHQDLQIDQGKYFAVQVNDVMEHQADLSLMNMFTDDAAKQLKIKIEEEVFFQWFVTEGAHADNKGGTAGARSDAYNLGTDTTPVLDTTASNILNTILKMSSVLDEQNIPESDRWLIISPHERNLLMETNIAQAYFTGDSSSIVRTGKIGMLDRFTVYVSNLLPRGTTGKAMVSGNAAVSGGGTLASAKVRRMMVAGHKSACTFASQISKTEPVRNQHDFGDIVRGLSVYGRKIVKDDALVTAIVGGAA